MKDLKTIVGNLMDVQINYYSDRKEIRSYFKDRSVVLSMLETYTEQIDRITDVILDDILEITCSGDFGKRTICFDIIDYTIMSQGEYRKEAIDLLMNWKNIGEFTKKVESRNWFEVKILLKEHKAGYPMYQKTLEKK